MTRDHVSAGALLVVLASGSCCGCWQIDPLRGADARPADAEDGPTTPAYPIYSSLFTGNTPFHHTVASLLEAGATVESEAVANHYWAEGVGTLYPFENGGGLGTPYLVHEGDPGYIFSCPAFSPAGKGCNASGMRVHYPVGATASSGSNHYLVSIDPVYLHGEVDGWGGYASNEMCQIDAVPGSGVTCSNGGFFPFDGGTGLAYPTGYAGLASGYAVGLISITAQELLQGHIDHALGIVQSCLDADGSYPATPGKSPNDAATCPSSEEPNAVFGDMIHLKAGLDVKTFSDNAYCRTVLTAFQDYGAYTSTNNLNGNPADSGITLVFEPPYNPAYDAKNPWIQTIFPSLVDSGDGTAGADGGLVSFQSCLRKVRAQDIEVIRISLNLPPATKR